MKYMFLFLSFIVWSKGYTQNITPVRYAYFDEYKINQTHYRVLKTQCGDKLFYFDSTKACWENIELEICDTTGCYVQPISVTSLNVTGNIMSISYEYLGQELGRYIYLKNTGVPDWWMTENQEEWQRY